jgi:hypothetical protein
LLILNRLFKPRNINYKGTSLCDSDSLSASIVQPREAMRITKDAWQQHAPSEQELTIPRVARRTVLAIALAWLITGLSVNALASALWTLIAP